MSQNTYLSWANTTTVMNSPNTSELWYSNIGRDTPKAATVTCSDVILNGKSLSSMFEKIEERLCILQPNADLESRWSELKSLKEQYQKLEKELLEKEKMWSVLKT